MKKAFEIKGRVFHELCKPTAVSMNDTRDFALIEELRAQPDETPWLEFKHNNADHVMIGKRCSALSNAARIEGRDCAFIVWGIADASHEVVGTTFRPDAEKVNGQVLQLWLANQLQPSLAFSFRAVEHPSGRIVLLEIPAAPGAPVSFQGVPYVRIGSATPKLTDYPERYQQLIERLRPYRWEHGIARQYASGDEVLELLDYSQYFRLTKQHLPDNRAGIFDKLEADRLIVRDVGERWNITNLGAILFATRLGDFEAGLARKAVRFVAYAGRNRAATVTHRLDGQKGYDTRGKSASLLLPCSLEIPEWRQDEKCFSMYPLGNCLKECSASDCSD